MNTFSLYVLKRLINELIMSVSPETDLITAGVMVCCWRAWTVCAMTFVSSSSWLLSSSWKVQKYNRFEECFAFLGTIPELAEETINLLEEYVCYIYRVKSRSFNNTKWKIFDKKYQRENKTRSSNIVSVSSSISSSFLTSRIRR